jgi:hypothetical protein
MIMTQEEASPVCDVAASDDAERRRLNKQSMNHSYPAITINDEDCLAVEREGAAFYESFVVPAFLLHEEPKRVLILTDNTKSSEAILKQVLKFKGVQEIVVVVDSGSTGNSSEYETFTKIRKGVSGNATKVEIEYYHQNWSEDLFDSQAETFRSDVIITETSSLLPDPLSALYDSLSKSGVFVAHLGNAPRIRSPPQENGIYKDRERFLQRLVEVGFMSVRDYEVVSAILSFKKLRSWMVCANICLLISGCLSTTNYRATLVWKSRPNSSPWRSSPLTRG